MAAEAVEEITTRSDGAFDLGTAAHETSSSVLTSIGPSAAALRTWAQVLMSSGAQWTPVLQERCSLRQQTLVQHRVQLIVPQCRVGIDSTQQRPPQHAESPSLSAASEGGLFQQAREHLRMNLWPRTNALNSVVVVVSIPLPDLASHASSPQSLAAMAFTRAVDGGAPAGDALSPNADPGAPMPMIDVLTPLGSAPGVSAVRTRVAPGSAVVLDGSTRWRLVEESSSAYALLVFEYRPQAPMQTTNVDPPPERSWHLATLRSHLGDWASVLCTGMVAYASGTLQVHDPPQAERVREHPE
jgi:hypothetical protein